jgi:hypothetical protein
MLLQKVDVLDIMTNITLVNNLTNDMKGSLKDTEAASFSGHCGS